MTRVPRGWEERGPQAFPEMLQFRLGHRVRRVVRLQWPVGCCYSEVLGVETGKEGRFLRCLTLNALRERNKMVVEKEMWYFFQVSSHLLSFHGACKGNLLCVNHGSTCMLLTFGFFKQTFFEFKPALYPPEDAFHNPSCFGAFALMPAQHEPYIKH